MGEPNHVLVMLMIAFFEAEQKKNHEQCTHAYDDYLKASYAYKDTGYLDHDCRKEASRTWNRYIHVAREIGDSEADVTLIRLRGIQNGW